MVMYRVVSVYGIGKDTTAWKKKNNVEIMLTPSSTKVFFLSSFGQITKEYIKVE